MDMITISAKTLDEAITKALLELQTTSDHLHYEVVQKENSGLFGFIGAKPCIIRAKVMSETEERAAKKAVEKAAAEKAAAKKTAEKEAEKAAAEKAIAEKTAAEKISPAAKPEEAETEKKQSAMDASAEKRNFEKQDSERKAVDRKRPERREGSRRERGERPPRRAAEPIHEEPHVVREEKPRQPVKADPEKVQAAAKEFLTNVFGAMGMEVSIETKLNLEEGELLVMMEGEDMGLLIGKRGQTLDSLQYLVSLVVNKETEGYLRVKLDTENYRERRKETLETLARNISYKVKRTRRPVSLEPMNPYERRIIHSTLQNDRYVVTRSEGEDPYRHVVISLKNDRCGGNGRRDRYPRRDRSARNYGRPSENRSVQEATAETVAETAELQVPAQENSSEE